MLVVLIFSAEESMGQLLRRNSHSSHSSHAQCAPQAVVVQDDVLVLDQQQFIPYQNQSPIIIQNNYPPVPQNISSLYGYAPQQLGYNPFQVDPAEMLREAARLADRQSQLQSETIKVYQQLGTDALGQAGLIAQLQARAALIDSTRPVVTQSLSTQITTGQVQQPQAMSQDQTICLIPDGQGGYRVQIGGQPSSSLPAENGSVEGLGILQTRCASCHTGSSEKGGGFALFLDDGTMRQLSETEKDRTLTLTRLGVMPQGSDPLSDTEYAALQLLLR